jgi:glycosyltransferase involved in cell wall biosynthesis
MTAASLSVVITCYSEGRVLLEAVASVKAQSWPAHEIVLVNDASIDQATQAACDEAGSWGCRVIRRSVNGGPSAARNDGFRAATGEVIVPVDADDLLPPGALASIRDALVREPSAGFIYGPYIRENRPGERLIVDPAPPELAKQLSSRPFSIGSSWNLLGTTPLRRSLWEDVGGYDATRFARGLEDVDLWIRLLSKNPTWARAESPLYVWRKHLGQTSRQVGPDAWGRLVRKHLDQYRQHGLCQRATELLLVDAKWRGDAAATSLHRAALLASCSRTWPRVATLMALAIPGFVFRAFKDSWPRQ